MEYLTAAQAKALTNEIQPSIIERSLQLVLILIKAETEKGHFYLEINKNDVALYELVGGQLKDLGYSVNWFNGQKMSISWHGQPSFTITEYKS